MWYLVSGIASASSEFEVFYFHDGLCDMYDKPLDESGNPLTLAAAAATTDERMRELAIQTADGKIAGQKVNGLESLALGYVAILGRDVAVTDTDGDGQADALSVTGGGYQNTEYLYQPDLQEFQNRRYTGVRPVGTVDIGGSSFVCYELEGGMLSLLARIG